MTENEKESFSKAINASMENGDRLLEDAEWLFDLERHPSAYALAILAQEEFAKAFLLHLVAVGAIPWNLEAHRVLRDHTCKQLLALIMEYLNPDIDEFLARHKGKLKLRFPSHVADALNIVRHEKIPREGQWAWLGEDDPPCDPKARKIADGHLDKQKQDALYVRLGKTGQVASTPLRIGVDQATEELEKTKRLSRVLNRPQGDISIPSSLDYERVVETFRLLFDLKTWEEYKKNWWA